MSITFWMDQAPVERVEWDPVDWPGDYEIRPVAPFMEINMTTGNANAILALIDPASVDPYEDPHGTWDMEALARVRSATIRALNTEIKNRAQKDPWESGGPGTGQCRVIECGRSRDYVVQRLEEFLALTKVAMDHGFPVSFG